MADTNKVELLNKDEVDELLSKYDPESAFRRLSGIMGLLVSIIAIAFSIYQIYATNPLTATLPAQIHRSIHMGFGLVLVFLLFPAIKKGNYNKVAIWDMALAVIAVYVSLYWMLNMDQLVMRVGAFNNTDLIAGGLAILVVLEGARRVAGLPIVVLAIIFLLYALFGKYMPGFLEHRGVSVERLIGHLFFTTEGILGTPLAVSSTFIFLFILFGAFLEKTGVGEYFNDLSIVIAGKRIGGPAKVAVFSSALQGMISGSSVANVVTSGAFTIPMMKKLGYKPEFAGAVEASSSTGGQIMPPVMGAAAFLMAEFIGVPYGQVALAATIPAILYFAGIWIMVHFEARRLGLRGLTEEEMPDRREVFKKLYLLLPIVVIIVLLCMDVDPILSALWGIVSTVLVGAVRKETRMSFKDILKALEIGAKTALGVVAATAAAGIIVGVVTLTGLGLKFANGLIDLAGGAVLLTLFFTMISSLVLGMGVPTTANYIITSTIAAPAIIKLGYPALSAHMFTFYFGIVADITPPVALAAFAAAGISKGNAFRTGVDSTRIAIAAFIIPYIFVLSPQILLIDTTFFEAAWVVITATAGMFGVGAGIIGFWLRRMNWIERIIAIAGGLGLIVPGLITDVLGLGTLVILFVIQLMQIRSSNKARSSAM